MPTIKQLPAATAVGGSDLVPVSQNGLTRSVTVGALLGNTQPMLSLAQGALLGRISPGLGSPEAVGVGTGLTLQSGTVLANGQDHLSLTLATSLLPGDEVLINSSGLPRRLPANQIRSLFSAGSGVQIDNNGVISATSTSSSGSTTSVGPKGDPGPQGAPGQGLSFRGSWQPGFAYNAYDVVTYNGQTYLAAVAIAAAATFSATSWSLMAAQGATGAQGSIGATGQAGPTLAATSSMIGAVKPGTGLTVTVDGTLGITNVSLSSIAQGSAAVGQLLGWSGTGWAPTTPAAGVSYSGTSPITVASGTISLAQNGASLGQTLTWTSSGWAPQTPAPTGALVGSALPLVDGVGSAGSATTASREDHRHPTDTSRAPLAAPIFTQSITLPVWTTATRPTSPTPGMEGYASDTGRRETYTASGWVQYVRMTDLPAAGGQLLAGTGVVGTVAPVSIGSGLSLAGGTLSATTTIPISGVVIDGNTIAASAASPYQMASIDRIVDVNKSVGSASQISLPVNPTLWVDYTIVDGKGDAAVNNIIISGKSGVTINGQSSFLMNANNDAITLRAITSTVWRIT